MSKNIKEDKIIKETKYCKIINQGKVGDDEYTYTIEKVLITILIAIKTFRFYLFLVLTFQ